MRAGRSRSASASSLYARPVAVRAAGALYPAAVVLTIVATGNHFVVDALAGVARDGARLRPRRASGGHRGWYHSRYVAGWSSQVARRAHNPEVAGSNPAPAMDKGPA